MDETKNGGPAFPIVIPANNLDRSKWQPGMTLRDYFAAQAVAGGFWPVNAHDHDQIAAWAYAVADAMLEAREVGK